MNNINYKKFSEINLNDSFFDSLRQDYDGFDEWFKRKKDQSALVQYDDSNRITGFLYLKIEKQIVSDTIPNITANTILKVGTFKIEAHGTKMGEQFIKKIMDCAVNNNVDVCYATIFPKQIALINLVEQFGFNLYGQKGNGNHKENVYLKQMKLITNNIYKDYPYINTNFARKYLLSIYPKYHSIMFPDSILRTENPNTIKDVSYSNSINKIYVCTMSQVTDLNYGDIVVLYRTAEPGQYAKYTAVATSICVVESVKNQNEFASFDEFYKYSCKYNLFNRDDLEYWYNKGNCKAIKMTYNAAFKQRIVRNDLLVDIGLDASLYWGFFELTDKQFHEIAQIGLVDNILL